MHDCLQLGRDADRDRFRPVSAEIQSYRRMQTWLQGLSHIDWKHLEQVIAPSFRAEQPYECNAGWCDCMQRLAIQLEVVVHDKGGVNRLLSDRFDR